MRYIKNFITILVCVLVVSVRDYTMILFPFLREGICGKDHLGQDSNQQSLLRSKPIWKHLTTKHLLPVCFVWCMCTWKSVTQKSTYLKSNHHLFLNATKPMVTKVDRPWRCMTMIWCFTQSSVFFWLSRAEQGIPGSPFSSNVFSGQMAHLVQCGLDLPQGLFPCSWTWPENFQRKAPHQMPEPSLMTPVETVTLFC